MAKDNIKVMTRKPGKVFATKSVTSGNVFDTTNSISTQAFLEQDSAGMIVIAGRLRVQAHRLMVMAYAVKISSVNQNL